MYASEQRIVDSWQDGFVVGSVANVGVRTGNCKFGSEYV